MTVLTRQNNHLSRITALKIYTPDECKSIIKFALNNWTEEKGTISVDSIQPAMEDLELRNTTLFIPPETERKSSWCEKINNTIINLNNEKESYGFDISGMMEPPIMMRYMAPDINPNKKAGKYDWHIDIGPESLSTIRKLSYSILLNVGEYEGGELEFQIGKNAEVCPNQTKADAQGSMILFPSYLLHRVLPIIKGIRYAIVGWMHGNSFR